MAHEPFLAAVRSTQRHFWIKCQMTGIKLWKPRMTDVLNDTIHASPSSVVDLTKWIQWP